MFGCNHDRCALRRKMGILPRSGGQPLPDLAKTTAEFRLSTGETLAEASTTRPLALVFLRHFGCTFTRQILLGLEHLQHSARSHDAELVLVHMLKHGDEIQYLGIHDEVARIADPTCTLYRAFGLGNGGLLELFGPRVWWLGFVSILKGCGVGHLAGNALQMPGAFVFHRGKIITAQRARSASDLPDLPALFQSTDLTPSP